MDDQALVEGSVVFKDEDDPGTKTEVSHSTVHHERNNMRRQDL